MKRLNLSTVTFMAIAAVVGVGMTFSVVDAHTSGKARQEKEAAEKVERDARAERRKIEVAERIEQDRREERELQEVKNAIAAPRTFTGTEGRMTSPNGEQTLAQIYNGRVGAIAMFECVVVKTAEQHFAIFVLNPNGTGHAKFSINGEVKDGGVIRHVTNSDGLHLYSGDIQIARLEFDRTETGEENQYLESMFQLGLQSYGIQ